MVVVNKISEPSTVVPWKHLPTWPLGNHAAPIVEGGWLCLRRCSFSCHGSGTMSSSTPPGRWGKSCFFYTPANEHSWLENVHLFDPEKTRRDFRDSHGLCYMFVSGRIFLKKKLGDRNFEDLSSDQENLLVGVYIYIHIYRGSRTTQFFWGGLFHEPWNEDPS